jgi:hypothetical protein
VRCRLDGRAGYPEEGVGRCQPGVEDPSGLRHHLLDGAHPVLGRLPLLCGQPGGQDRPTESQQLSEQGQEPVQLRLADVVPAQRFVDEAEVDGTIVRTTHRLEPVGGGRTRAGRE